MLAPHFRNGKLQYIIFLFFWFRYPLKKSETIVLCSLYNEIPVVLYEFPGTAVHFITAMLQLFPSAFPNESQSQKVKEYH